MEFYLYNKDDRKLKTLVNLATTFKIGETNYIVYYNTQTEKSVIDIYIGKISYGDESLVINKIATEKQGEFLSTIKDILASKNPETSDSDYQNIIDTATIILEEVQKIQIPTSSLDMLLNYKKKVEPSMEEIVPETNTDINSSKINLESENKKVDESDNNQFKDETIDFDMTTSDVNAENNDNFVEKEQNVLHEENSNLNSNVIDNNYIRGNDKLSDLDNMINEQQDKNNKKKEAKQEKMISTPILVMLVLVVIIAIVLLIIEKLM